jgi:hypothetical protein
MWPVGVLGLFLCLKLDEFVPGIFYFIYILLINLPWYMNAEHKAVKLMNHRRPKKRNPSDKRRTPAEYSPLPPPPPEYTLVSSKVRIEYFCEMEPCVIISTSVLTCFLLMLTAVSEI